MSAKPHRVQLSRKKGWRMPENTVSVARPGPWGNPWKIGDPDANGTSMKAEKVVEEFRRWSMRPAQLERISALRGKNLACWCRPDRPCHADVLLELANAEPPHVG